MRRGASLFALIWAAAVYVWLLTVPTYPSFGTAREPLGRVGDSVPPVMPPHVERAERVERVERTMVEVNGQRMYLVLAVPLLAAALSLLPGRRPFTRAARVGGAIIALSFCLLGMWTVGAFFLPAALALAIAAFPERSTATGRSAS